MQTETYRCPDGREVVLTYNEDTFRVEAISRDGKSLGWFQFGLVGADGGVIDLMDDSDEAGEAVALKLLRNDLIVGWRSQGIREYAAELVAAETGLELLDEPARQSRTTPQRIFSGIDATAFSVSRSSFFTNPLLSALRL